MPMPEVITDPSFPEAGPFRGRQTIRDRPEGLKESWEEEGVLTELFDIHGKVVARLTGGLAEGPAGLRRCSTSRPSTRLRAAALQAA
jgi:hypothetical protein